MIIDSGNNPFYVLSMERIRRIQLIRKSRNKSKNSSSELPSSSDVGPEDNDEIMFDFTRFEMELLREQSN
jgi:hypothetical protein